MYNFAGDRRRRWTTRNPAADIDLPRAPTYTEIRYLTTDEGWALVDAARPGDYQQLDRAMYLTAAMTGLRIGELQGLDWRGVDFVHARIRVRRTWDRKAKTFTTPKSRRSERAVPMPTLQEWMGHKDIQTTQRYADYCPNPGERHVVEAAFARGTTSGTNLPTPLRN